MFCYVIVQKYNKLFKKTSVLYFYFLFYMQHSISQRINFLVDHYSNGIGAKFATSIGFAKQSITRLSNPDLRNNKFPIPSTELLLAICEKYPEVNPGWLLTGVGEPFLTADKKMVIEDDKDWKTMYFEIVTEKEILAKKYMTLLEKVAKP